MQKEFVSRNFFNAYYSKTHLIKALNSLESSKPYGRLKENKKTWCSRELFLPENDFQASSTEKFSIKNRFWRSGN